MCFLVDRCNPTLIFGLTNAERMCLKESQAEGNPYLCWWTGYTFCLCFRSPHSLLGACWEGDLQNPAEWVLKAQRSASTAFVWWLPGRAKLRSGLGLSQCCPSPAGKQSVVQVHDREAVLGLQGCNTDTWLLVLWHGGETGTNCKSWVSHSGEFLVNQVLEKTFSLTSVDFWGSQRAKHLPGSGSNPVSLL